MDKYLQDVGARIREARMKKGLSQAQLAEMLGLTPPYISNIETMGLLFCTLLRQYSIMGSVCICGEYKNPEVLTR